jgi:uncharacterized protein
MFAALLLSLPPIGSSVQVRTGMPKDEPADLDLNVWAGVLPVAVMFGEPLADPLLRDEIPLPVHIRDRVG